MVAHVQKHEMCTVLPIGEKRKEKERTQNEGKNYDKWNMFPDLPIKKQT